MRWRGWEHVKIDPVSGEIREPGDTSGTIDAIAPIIISASRSTDIPALYGDWFIERLRKGYANWTNPFSGQTIPISFGKTRVFVFWSKNPAPFLPALEQLLGEGRQILLLFTLNDYEQEGLEPGIPDLGERVETFIECSRLVGRNRITWRFDPLVLTETLDIPGLLGRISDLGEMIAPYAGRLVMSFIDIERYPRVKRNLAGSGIPGVRGFSAQEIQQVATGLRTFASGWDMDLQVCGEGIDLSGYGIGRGACISFDTLLREFPHDRALMEFLEPPLDPGLFMKRKRELKDPGQRGRCGCVASKDIGCYSTCILGCRYCYATSSRTLAAKNYRKFCDYREEGIFPPGING